MRAKSTAGYAVVAVIFVVLLVAGVAVMYVETLPGSFGGPGTTAPASLAGVTTAPPSAAPSGRASAVEGVPTVTEGCPAAAVAGAKGACVRDAECWGGLVFTTGKLSVRRIACEEEHVWETFALAPLPVDALTFYLDDLEKHPVIRRTCSKRVMLASRYGRARAVPAARWTVSVMPPTEEQFARGVRTYRCVGGVVGASGRLATGTFFRPLA